MRDRGVVVGHGLDLVDIDHFSLLMKEPARNFLDRYFSDEELLASGGGVTQVQRLAGRFAVKEAVMKALGVGWGNGISYTDVEVITLSSGAPTVALKRQLAILEQERSISGWFVSVSHTNTVAVASVIAISNV
jgi:holo-[acyl-carrier protein] synthase